MSEIDKPTLKFIQNYKGPLIAKSILKKRNRDFPGGLMVKNLPYNAGEQVGSLVRELRSHVPRGN